MNINDKYDSKHISNSLKDFRSLPREAELGWERGERGNCLRMGSQDY